jgi:hypothetical protein
MSTTLWRRKGHPFIRFDSVAMDFDAGLVAVTTAPAGFITRRHAAGGGTRVLHTAP